MRINTGAFYDSVSQTVTRMQTDLGDLSTRMSSGKRVAKPSDDPLASVIIARTYTDLAASDARKRVFDNGLQTQGQVDAALSQISDQLAAAVNTARSALQLTSQDEATRSASAVAIRSNTETIVTAANTRLGERYLFGGFKDRTAPVTGSATAPTYQGDSHQPAVPLGSGRVCQITVSGDRLLNIGGAGGVSGVTDDVFTVLERVAQSIETGDTATTRTGLDQLSALQAHVVSLRGAVGSWQQRLQASRDALDDADTQSQTVLNTEETLDVASAVTEYSARETSYKAVLNVFSRLMALPTMFDLTR